MGQVFNMVDIHLWAGTMPPVLTAKSADAKDLLGESPFIPIGNLQHLIESMPDNWVLMGTEDEPTEKVLLMFVDRVLS
tara:strand:- start:2100 stop:2333 length:234 start_codon:yes stop_codon:yes gene_type:complete